MLVLLVAGSSCGVRFVEINGWTNDFEKLTEEQRERVFPLEDFSSMKAGTVYKITIPKLQGELMQVPKAIVRVFNPGCSSKVCKPLSYYQNHADTTGCPVYQIMTGYSDFESVLKQGSCIQLFVIDNDYYGEQRRYVYERYFTNELMGLPRETRYKDVPEEMMGQLYYFEFGKLVKVANELDLEWMTVLDNAE